MRPSLIGTRILSQVANESQVGIEIAGAASNFHVKFNADKQIAMYNMQVDEKLTEMIALAEEQSVISTCELNKARVERGLQLNTQAQGLSIALATISAHFV